MLISNYHFLSAPSPENCDESTDDTGPRENLVITSFFFAHVTYTLSHRFCMQFCHKEHSTGAGTPGSRSSSTLPCLCCPRPRLPPATGQLQLMVAPGRAQLLGERALLPVAPPGVQRNPRRGGTSHPRTASCGWDSQPQAPTR